MSARAWLLGAFAVCAAPGAGAWPVQPDVSDDAVIASARGPLEPIAITAGRLRAFAAGREGKTGRALAEELVEFELLAQDARQRGLADNEDVRYAAATAMVRRYLVDVFAVEWADDRLPREMVESAYTQNRHYFVHPELRRTSHLLVTDEGKLPAEKTAAANAIAARIHADLRADPPSDEAAFRARAARFAAEAEAVGLLVSTEALPATAREGPFVEPYLAAIFALPRVGAFSSPFATDFGVHIARLDALTPAQNHSLADVEAEVRARIGTDVRAHELRKLIDALARRHDTSIHFAPLESVERRRAGGEDEARDAAPGP